MTDELFFGNKKYIPASQAAAISNLSRDYIARLCRGGKILGRQVGKNWYVEEGSLSEFLLEKQFAREIRREELAKERATEYLRGSIEKKSESPLFSKNGNDTNSVSAEKNFDVHEALAKALSHKAPTIPSGVVHAAATASSHLPFHVLPQVSEIAHRLIGITVALALTIGTYAIVNPNAVSFAMGRIQNAGHALEGAYASLRDEGLHNAREQFASAILWSENISSDPAFVANAFSKFVKDLARNVNSRVNTLVYQIAFPESLVGSKSNTADRGTIFSGTVVARVTATPRTQVSNTSNIANVTNVTQPVIERVVETQRIVSSAGGITEEILTARLAQLDASLSARIASLTSANTTIINNTYETLGAVARSDNFDDINISDSDITDSRISGGTISGATITGSTISADSLSGVVAIANGGTGTSTAPTYGKILVGQSDGTYALVATSSLGISGGGAGTIDGTGFANMFAYFVDSDTLAATSSPTAGYFVATSTVASQFPYASTTAITISGTASTTNLVISSAAGTGVRCAQIGPDGTLSASSAACGTGGFDFTPTAYGNATSTLLQLTAGFISNASSTISGGLTISGTATSTDLAITNITSSLLSTNALGQVVATTSLSTNIISGTLPTTKGGTGTSTPANYGDVLTWNGSNWQGFSTSTLGLVTFADLSSYTTSAFPFTATTYGSTAANATSTLIGFNAGLYALASSTIGSGAANGGLTVNGNATTTGNLFVAGGKIGIGTPAAGFNAPLSFGASLGDKTYYYDAGVGSSYGIGIQNLKYRFFTDGSGADIQFGYGGASADGTFTPNVTFRGNGYSGFGTSTPYAKITAWGSQTLFEAVNTSSTTIFKVGQSGATTTNLAITALSNTLLAVDANGNVIATSTPVSAVWGNITGTLSNQTDLQNALNGKISVGTTSVGSITSLPNLSITSSQVSDFNTAVGSYISSSSTVPHIGGTAYGDLLTWNGTQWAITATTSLGLVRFSDLSSYATFAFPFTPTAEGNSTSTKLLLTAGFIANASSTIGNGTQTGGLTISGGATTTGNAYFGGNVGVGIEGSASTLHVRTSSAGVTANTAYDDLVVENSGSAGITILGGSSSFTAIQFGDSGNNIAGSIGYGHNGDYLYFRTTGSERMRIDSSGRVGIGDTTQDAYLEVSASGGGTDLFMLSSNDDLDGDRFIVKNSGNVGIGTTSPFATLSVAGDIFANGNITGANLTATGTLTVAGAVTFSNYTNGALGVTANGSLYTFSTSTWSFASSTLLTDSNTFSGTNTFTTLKTGSANQFLYTNAAGVVVSAASSSLNLPNTALQNSSITINGNSVSLGSSITVASTTLLTDANNWSALQTFANITATRATTTQLGITGITSSLLKTNADGTVVAAIAGTDYLTSANVTPFAWTPTANGNSTSTRLLFTNGFISNASSTIAAGLTVSGNATSSSLAITGITSSLLSTNSLGQVVATTSLSTNLLNGTLGVANGGTGATSFGQGWLFSNGGTGALSASTSPTVAWLTATSTTATSTFAGGLNVGNGALTYDFTSGVTSIDNLTLGALSFEADAGIVSWVDMPVTSSASAGTVESYSARIDGNSILTVYSESDGNGGIRNARVGIGTSTPYAALSVVGQVVGAYFTATTSQASIFPYASTTAITATTASTTNLILSSAGGTGTRCLQVGADGTISATAAACGAGSSTFAWTPTANGNSTSTTLIFGNGFVSQASSTISSSLNVSGAVTLGNYTNGALGVSSNGSLYTFSTSTWTFASSTLLTDANNWSALQTFANITATRATTTQLGITGITNALLATNADGTVIATSTISTNLLNGTLSTTKGGTGTSTPANYGDVLTWNGSNWQGFSTSTLGLVQFSDLSSYISAAFAWTPTSEGNSTSTKLLLTAGFIANASSTIGNGTQTGGLTIAGGATTTATSTLAGLLVTSGNVGIGTSNPAQALDVNGFVQLTKELRFTDASPIIRYSTTGRLLDVTSGVFRLNPDNTLDVNFITDAGSSLYIKNADGNVGLGTTSPFARLSVAGSIFANDSITGSNITATGTLTVAGNTSLQSATSTNFAITNIISGLLSTNSDGTVIATSTISTNLLNGTLPTTKGGTGTSTPGNYGDVLTWNGSNWQGFSTSTLGLVQFSDLSSYISAAFAWTPTAEGNATSTKLLLTAGFISNASSTIGNGTQTGGLTIAGGATTTGTVTLQNYTNGALGVTSNGSLYTFSTSSWKFASSTLLVDSNYFSGNNIFANPLTIGSGSGTTTINTNIGITGNIIPSVDDTYTLGSPSYQWQDVYIGPGSLYVNGKQVIHDVSNVITISTDLNQNLSVQTSGSGNVDVSGLGSGNVNLESNSGNINILSTSGNVNLGTTGSGLLNLGTVNSGVWHGTAVGAAYGGTGSTTLTGILKGNGTGVVQTAVAGTDYLAPSALGDYVTWTSATSSLWKTAGILATASSTIGNGTQAGGLTIAGGATTTGNAYFAGNVGVGGQPSSRALEVTGTARVSSTFSLGSVVTCTGNKALQTNGSGDIACGTITVSGASVGGGWTTDNNGNVTLATTTDAVGIGASTTPYAKLTIISSNAASSTLALLPASGATANILDIYDTNGVVMSVLTADHKLGIGTASPSYKLDVQGNVGISSTLNVSGLATLSAGFISTGSSTVAGGLTVSGTATSSNLAITGVTSSLLSTNSLGQVVATSTLSTNYLSGSLGTINNTTFNAGSSITITAASSTLLANSNYFSGTNTFSNLKVGSANQFLYTNAAGVVVSAASSSLSLPNAALQNSSITVNGSSVSLGGTITVASTTLLTDANNWSALQTFANITATRATTTQLGITGITNGLLATDANGTVVATSSISTNLLNGVLPTAKGGTGTSTPANYGDVLTWNGSNWQGFSTSTLGLVKFSDLSSYISAAFAWTPTSEGNSTSTKLLLTAGFISNASSTIGGGTQTTGLTVSGGATTTATSTLSGIIVPSGTGNVGIGTSNPTSLLTVSGNVLVNNSGTLTAPSIFTSNIYESGSSNNASIQLSSGKYIAFKTNGIEWARVDASGNLGLGSTTAAARLGVHGDIFANGNITGANLIATGTLTASGTVTLSNYSSGALGVTSNGSLYTFSTSTWTFSSSTLLVDSNHFTGTNYFSNTIQGDVSGNAGTATALQTARTINNVSFDGTANITITAASSTLLGDVNFWTGTQTFSNLSATHATSTYLGITGLTNALLATNADGTVVATTTLATSYLSGSLGTINNTTFNAGSSITITAASSTLLVDSNNFTGTNTFGRLTATYASTTQIGSTQSAYFATTGGSVGVGTTTILDSKLSVGSGNIAIRDGADGSSRYKIGLQSQLDSTAVWKSYLFFDSTTNLHQGSVGLYVNRSSGGSGGQNAFISRVFDDPVGYPNQNTHLTLNSLSTAPFNTAVLVVDTGNSSANTRPSALFGNSVGIGSTSTAPAYKLDVTGNARFSSFVDASHFVATSTSATSTFAGGFTVQSTALVVQDDSGKVGIGTANPKAGLHVVNSNGITISDVDDGNQDFILRESSSVGLIQGANGLNFQEYDSGWITRMTIQNTTGNVGIATTSPFATLSVGGSTYLGGSLTATGTVAFTNYSNGALAADGAGNLYTFSTSTWTFSSSTLLVDSNHFTGTNTFANTINGSITGNAGTATALQTARTINNVSFDGTANITITAASSTLLANSNYFSGNNIFAGNTTLTNATSTNFAITNITSTILKTNASGSIIPAVAGTDYLAPSALGDYVTWTSATSSLWRTAGIIANASSTIGNGTQAGGLTISGGATTTGNAYFAGQVLLEDGSAASPALTFNADTNTGIYRSASDNLGIAAAGTLRLLVSSSGNTLYGTTKIGSSDTDLYRQAAAQLRTSGDLLVDGNVGIASTSPSAKLTVGGSTYLGGSLTATGTVTLSNYSSGALGVTSNGSLYTFSTSTWTFSSSTLLVDSNHFTGTNYFSNTIQGDVSGNAGTATALQTARTINNVSFDGTANITITAASSTLLGDVNFWTGTQTFSNLSATHATSTYLGITGLTNALLATNADGTVVATTTLATSYLSGSLGTINNTTFNAGSSITITAASSTLLANSNYFSGNNIFAGNTTLTNATSTNLAITNITSTVLKTDASGNVIPAVAGTDYLAPSALGDYVTWTSATSSLWKSAGLLATASSTIGNGTQAGGLTISGGATTTGNAYFGGTVGIGTNAPSGLLELSAPYTSYASYASAMLRLTPTGGSAPTNSAFISFNGGRGVVGYDGNRGSFVIGDGGTSKPIVFDSGSGYGVERVRITSIGNVGIASTSPSATLTVGGSTYLGGSLTATGTVAFTNYTNGALGVTSSGSLYTFSTSTWSFASSTLLTDANYWSSLQTFGNILASNATTSNFAITNITNGLLATNANGTVVATSSISTNYLTGTLGVANGGTGATSFGQGWLFSSGGTSALSASTSPTVAWLTATSTTATSTFAGGLDVGNGALRYDFTSGITSIDSLTLGAMNFDTDAGAVSWVDLPVTSSASAGTVESYSAQIDGNPLLTIYSESDGSGGIRNARVGIGTSTPYAALSVVGQTVAEYFTATSTTIASNLPLLIATNATTTNATSTNFFATALVATGATTTNLRTTNLSAGGATTTGLAISGVTSSLLKTNANGSVVPAIAGTDYVAGSSYFSYPFPNNATSTQIDFSNANGIKLSGLSAGGLSVDSSGNTYTFSTSTWTFASSTLLVDSNNFTGTNTFGRLTATYASTTQIGSTGSAYFATSGGNVGIGTTTPGAKLETYLSSGSTIARFVSANDTDGYVFFGPSNKQWRLTGYGVTGDFALLDAVNSKRPLYIESNTPDRLLYLDNSGYVGIGTTTPVSLLHLSSNATTLTIQDANSAYPTATADIQFLDNGTQNVMGTIGFSGNGNLTLNQNNTSKYIALTGSSVGIGTTTPDKLLTLQANATTPNNILGINNYNNGDTRIVFSDTGVDEWYLQRQDANNRFGIVEAGVAERLSILPTTGYVGIGTTTPENTLDVQGNIGIKNSGYLRLYDTNDSQYASIRLNSGTVIANYPWRLSNYSNGAIGVDGSGNLYTFSTSTWTFASSTLLVDSNNFTGTNTFGRLTATYASTTQIGSTGSAYFATSGGKVGVGTASPASPLHVYQNDGNTNTATGLTIEQAGAGDVYTQYLLTGTRRWLVGIDNSDNDTFSIGTGTNDLGTSAMLSITTSGNIGIGTTSPFAKLSVAGDIFANSNITGANLTATGTLTAAGAVTFSNLSSGFVGSNNGLLYTFSTSTLGFLSSYDAWTHPSTGVSATTSGLIVSASSTIGNGTQGGGLVIAGGATTTSSFYVGTSTAHLFVDSEHKGYVGLGTSNPTSALYVNVPTSDFTAATFAKSQSANDTGLYLAFTGASGASRGFVGYTKHGSGSNTFFTGETADAFAIRSEGAFQVGTGGDNIRMTILSTGEVGLNDTTPSQLLDIDGTNPQILTEESTTEFFRAGVGETAGTSVLGWDDSDSLLLGVYSNPTDTTIDEKVRITSTGNVGIGSSTPAAKLGVHGDIFANGNVTGANLSATGTLSATGAVTLSNYTSGALAVTSSGALYTYSTSTWGFASSTLLVDSNSFTGTNIFSNLKVGSANQFLYTNAAGVVTSAASSSLSLPNAALQNSSITVNGSSVSLGGSITVASTTLLGDTNYWTNLQTFGSGINVGGTTYTSLIPTSRTLTVAGTANQISSSAGAQDLSANRTWTLSLPSHVIFPSSFQATLASTTNATTSNFAITNIASSLLSTNANGTVVATSSISTNYLTGTIGVANGGTGASTFGQGWLYSAGGTSALSASTSPTVAWLTATSTTATSTFAGGLDVGNGALTYDFTSGVTSIDNLALGALTFDADAGILSWIDMPVTSSASAGTVESYSAQIDGNPLLTIYSESDGSGGIQNTAVGIGTTSPYAKLSVVGQTVAEYFTATSTTAINTFPLLTATTATTTNLAVTGVTSSLLKTNALGQVVAAVAGTDYTNFSYLFPSNATSTLLAFDGGLTAYASSTIGAGGQATGLTINGGATTTGNAYFAGNVGVQTMTPTARFQVGTGTPVTSTFYNNYGALFIGEKGVLGSDDDHANVISDLTLDSSGATSELITALASGINIKSGNNNNFLSTVGAILTATHNGGGTASFLYGSVSQATNAAAGTVTALSGSTVEIVNSGGGTVTSGYGLRVSNLSNSSGTITNTYGVYIGDVTAGTQTNLGYGLYSEDTSARNYFGGSVGVGTTTPYSKLTVWGTASLFEAVNSASTTIFRVGQNGATTTALAISSIASSLLKTDASGNIVPAVAGTDYANFGYLFPSNATTTGLGIYASTTIGNGTAAGGLTIDGVATSTLGFYVGTTSNNTGIFFPATASNNQIFGITSQNSNVDRRIGFQNTYMNLNQNGTFSFVVGGSTKLSLANSGTALGIGTTTPFANLAINPTAGSASNMFVVGSSTATKFIIDNSGSVGIGTTTPGSVFSIASLANFTTATSTFYSTGGINLTGGGCFAINGVCISGGGGSITGSGTSGRVAYWDGTSSITSNAGFTFDGTTLGVPQLAISGGLVSFSSIATTTVPNNSPYAWTIATSTTANPLFRIDSTSGSEAVTIGTLGGDVYIGDVGAASNLIFEESSTISGQGTNTLTFGVTGDKINFAVNTGFGSSTPWGMVSINPDNITGPAFVIGSSTATQFVVTNGGRVGVGTVSPASDMELSSSGATNLRITSTASNASPKLQIVDANSYWEFVKPNNSRLAIRLSGTDLFAFTNSGSLGIGDTGPDSLLEVSASAGTSDLFMLSSDDATDGDIVIAKNSGKVGIGTTSPSRILTIATSTNAAIHVYDTTNNRGAYFGLIDGFNAGIDSAGGVTQIRGNGTTYLTVGDTGNSYFNALGTSGKVGVASSSPWALFSVNPSGIGSAPAFAVGSSTATNFVVTNAGRVGIGTTTPGSIFSIGDTGGINFSTATSTFSTTGGINIKSGCFAINGVCVGGGSGSGTVGSGTTGQFPYYAGSGTTLTATSSIYLATSGKVGIGTTTPGSTLTVSAATGNTDFMVNSAAGSSAIYRMGKDGVSYWHFERNLLDDSFRIVRSGVDYALTIASSTLNVGIGSTTPWGLLSVNPNNISGPAFVVGSSTKTLFQIGNDGVTTVGDPTGTGDATFQFASDSNAWAIGYNSTDKSFNIASSTNFSSSVALTILKSGLKVGISTTSPYATLAVAGDFAFSNSATLANENRTICGSSTDDRLKRTNGACATSSLRYKENIEGLTYGLDAIRQLNPIFFNYIVDSAQDPNKIENQRTKRRVGFVAEEMQQVIPEVVIWTDDNQQINGIDYAFLTAVLAKGMQELDLNLQTIASTTASSTPASRSFADAFFSRLTQWFADAANNIGEMIATTLRAKEQICVDDQCLTKDDVRALIQIARGQTASAATTGGSGGSGSTGGSQSSGGSSGGSTGGTGTTTPTTTDKAPVITLMGDNPTRVAVGDSYTDLGVLVSDDHDQNLGVTLFVDGAHVTAIHLDTSTTTSYEIKYRVVDSADNVAEKTRTVEVYKPSTNSTGTTTPETTTEPEPDTTVPTPEPSASSTPSVTPPGSSANGTSTPTNTGTSTPVTP